PREALGQRQPDAARRARHNRHPTFEALHARTSFVLRGSYRAPREPSAPGRRRPAARHSAAPGPGAPAAWPPRAAPSAPPNARLAGPSAPGLGRGERPRARPAPAVGPVDAPRRAWATAAVARRTAPRIQLSARVSGESVGGEHPRKRERRAPRSPDRPVRRRAPRLPD